MCIDREGDCIDCNNGEEDIPYYIFHSYNGWLCNTEDNNCDTCPVYDKCPVEEE